MPYDPLNIGTTENTPPPAVVAGYDPLGINTPEPTTPLASHDSPTPDLSWRQGKPKGPIDKLKDFIGLSDNKPHDSAKAANALTYSEMLGVSPSIAYDNHDEISKRMREAAPGEKIDTRTRGGVGKAVKAGAKSSLVGMMANQKAPEPFESLNQFERWAEMGTQMALDLPAFLAGDVVGGPAGGFGFTAGMRQLLTETYQKGKIKTPQEFFDRTINAVKQTVGGEIVGAAFGVAGKVPGPGYVKAASELAAMTTMSKVIQGELPTAQDFIDNAVVFAVISGGVKGKDYILPKLHKMYSKYGLHPDEVAEEIKSRIPGGKENPSPEEVKAALRDIETDLQEKTALKPAIKKADGEVIKGKLGQTHEDILRNEPGIVFDEAADEKVFTKGEDDKTLTREEAKEDLKTSDPETYQNWIALNGKGEDGELHSQDYMAASEITPVPSETAKAISMTPEEYALDVFGRPLAQIKEIVGPEAGDQVMEAHRLAVESAHAAGQDVPAKVLEAYGLKKGGEVADTKPGEGSAQETQEGTLYEKTLAGDQGKLFATPPTFGKHPKTGEPLTTADFIDNFTPDPQQDLFGKPERFSVFQKSEAPKSRTIGDVIKDMRDAIGERGAIGDQEATDKQKAARERLRKDVEALKANATKAGKELGEYLKDLGYDDPTIERIMAFAGATGGPQAPEDKEAEPIFNETAGPAVSPVTEANAPDHIGRAWNKIKNLWIGEKDVAKSQSEIEARLLKRDLIDAMGDNPFTFLKTIAPGYADARAYIKDLNKAIQIYIDTKRDSSAIERTEGALTEEQKRILDLSQNLPKEIMPVVERIQKAYADIAKTQYDSGMVKNFIENFVNRVWNLDDKGRPSDDTRAKFGLKTRHAKERQFETILDGWAAGYDLKVEGAIDALKVMREEISKVVANKELIEAATRARDIEGRPIMATPQTLAAALRKAKEAVRIRKEREESGEIAHDAKAAAKEAKLVADLEKGYRKVPVSGFKHWEWAGKIEAATTERITQTRNVLSETISVLTSKGKTPSSKVEAKVREALTARGWSEGEANQMIERVKNAEPGEKQNTIIERTIEKTITREIATEVNVKQYGKDFFIKDANIYENRDLYAREDIAKNLDHMLSKVHPPDWADKIAKYNAISKGWVLASGFFHNIAGMYNYYLGTGKVWKDMSIRKAYKEGMKQLEERNPVLMEGIKNGLTIGARQDWQEHYLQEKTWFGKQVDKLGFIGEVKDKLVELRELQSSFLFEEFFSGLKAMQYLDEYKGILERHEGIDPDKAAHQAAAVTNANYGGLKLEQLGKWNPTHEFRMGRDPRSQFVFHLLALAPDWCILPDTRAMTKNGWKYYHELTVGLDEILAFNPVTNKYQWSVLNDMYVNKEYKGKMVFVKNHNRLIGTTPHHKNFVWNISKKKFEVVLSENLNSAHRIPRSAGFDFPSEEEYTDYFVKIVGWFVTDGYIKSCFQTRSTGEYAVYRYGKITQSKPNTVEILKNMGMLYHVEKTNCDHDKFKANYPKHIFTIPKAIFEQIENDHITRGGLNWDFLSKLTKRQLELLYDTMMLGDGTGQNRFCGQEKAVFYMTMIQTMLGKPSTFYQQEDNCWRTRVLQDSKKFITCSGTISKEDYEGAIWCPSVDTGFWLAEREGLMFITGNTESNIQLVGNALKGVATGSPQELEVYQRLVAKWAIRGTGALVIGNFVLAGGDLDKMIDNFERSWKEGNLNWMRWDITPIFRMFGGDQSKHKYISAFGHMEDPVKSVLHTGQFLKNKSSIIGKTLLDGITGRDWQGKAFTEFGDLWQTGKAVKWSATAHPIDFSTFPAYAITEIIGTEPIQLQNLLGWTMGQEDAFDMVLKSTGLRENTANPKKVK
jgi:hypothetical protein